MVVIVSLFKASIALLLGVACVLVAGMFYSRYLKKQSIQIERHFLRNFRVREVYARHAGTQVPPKFAGHLLSRDLHMADFIIPSESLWAGYTLADLALGSRFGVMVVAVFRGQSCINIPGGKERLFPQDRVQVIGSDEQLERFGNKLQSMTLPPMDSDLTQSEVCLKQFVVTEDSPFNGKSIRDSGIPGQTQMCRSGCGTGNGFVKKSGCRYGVRSRRSGLGSGGGNECIRTDPLIRFPVGPP